MGTNRLILGGAWDETGYMGFTADAYDPFRREGNFGFRCMKYIGQPELAAKALDPIAERIATDLSKVSPCSDEVFGVIKGIYSYPKTDLEPTVEFRREYSEYAMLEKVSFWDAYRRFRVSAYIFLPRKSKPPFQTVFYYPGAHAWRLKSFSDYPLPEGELYFKHGRAFVFPVLPRMFERKSQEPAKKTYQEMRERIIRDIQDFLRCIDYVETRPADFRVDKLAYHGLSAGANIASKFGALEPRLRAIVAIGGGLMSFRDESPYYPELDWFNFPSRVKIPYLMVNGKYDVFTPVNTTLKVFWRLLGTPEKDKYLNLYDTGHIAITPKSFKDILDFLDKYLGPVE
jgi:dienelactone hydrolase